MTDTLTRIVERQRERARDFLWFGLKETRSCLFAGGFFAILALSKWLPLGDLPRYDFLLLAALGLQALLLWLKLETWEEVRTISLFHLLGFVLEVFKTHPAIGSWSYPEAGYTKVLGVPLYAGFMYAAVASYMTRGAERFLSSLLVVATGLAVATLR